ncbi:MAG: TerC family protein [Alphaproteobacteria bacterium]|jgi:predicted tellurium resistance membrane protein TerC
MENIFCLENLVDFVTLSGLEIILGIDNIIFLAILVHHLPEHRRNKIRFFGLSLAIALRIVMLFGVSWVMSLTKPWIIILGIELSGHSFMLLTGGLFLIIKSLVELFEMFEASYTNQHDPNPVKQPEWRIILQIVFVDLILSFDSVIVAVAMISNLYLIIAAILLAMIIMLVASKAIGDFMYKNPSIKVIGLAFILLVGIFLMGNGFGYNLPKGYLYFAMFFSLLVEVTNIKLKNNQNRSM